ncbi:MAG: DEAD/DEAH box helicase [Prolixibacteraceae bacterium]|jgi:ATP-dependent RNA helicase RhlE|nr:DEAD/DEAH box helicase [Prolixibacteraceae bacterium]
MSEISFSSLGLSASLLSAIDPQKYKAPFPIQEKVIPPVLSHKDVLGIAPTGQGKSISYVLPLLSNLHDSKKSKNRHVSVLVLVPTRELAVQVNEVFQLFSSKLDPRVKSLAVFGGVSINPQMIALQGVEVLIATPGRLIELVENNAIHLDEIKTLVLDEADKMLNLGFREEMSRIFSMLPQKRQNLLFSATLSEDLTTMHQILLDQPFIFKIESETNSIELINQLGYFVSDERKGPLLRYLIKSNKLKQVLVFASSVKRVDNIATKLRANGIDAMAIHSKKTQGVRSNLITKFKYGKLNVLVTTDLLARGIDIDFLPTVINYELPRSPKDYIHRIGRTGRAENPGDAISFVTPEDQAHFKVIQKKMGRWVTMNDSDSIDLKGY